MPRGSPASPSADPFEQAHLAARELARRTGVAHHDALVVLGSGLAGVAPALGAADPPVDLSTLPWFSRFTGIGHRAAMWSVTVGGTPVLVTAGRAHLYEGVTEQQAAHTIRTAIANGCRTVVLTGATGSLRPEMPVGAVVAISDHLNLTGRSPLIAMAADHPAGSPFVDLVDAWSPRLRRLAATLEPGLPEGIYAQVPGPHLETPAEIRMLAALGADLVGMSMATEAIAARHLGSEVLGLAVVTNPAAGLAEGPLAASGMVDAAASAVPTLTRIISGVLAGLAS